MSTFEEFLNDKLHKRKVQGSLRALTLPAGSADFASNDYLGLARSRPLFERIRQVLEDQNLYVNGSTGSRLLAGNSGFVLEAERSLATRFRAECALLFNSGYSANLSVLSALPQKDDTLLLDERAHASLKDGARLSLAKHFSFEHNNLDDLERRLKRATGRTYIVVESVYSMDGDECPLQQLCDLADRYEAVLILDEAHSTGVLGTGGNGMANNLNLSERIHVRIYTFGKAMGVHGACVTGSQSLIDYLVNFARTFIYTTALPPHSVASIRCAFEHLDDHPELQVQLQTRIKLFRDLYQGETHSRTAIQPVVVPGNEFARALAGRIQKHGMDVRPILSPTVKEGTERLRICLHTFNTDEEIMQLTKYLNDGA